MEFYRIWLILIGNRWLLIWLPIIAGSAGLALSYVLPEQYEATALVIVRPSEDIKFNSNSTDRKEMLDFPVSQAAPIDAPSKTYIEEIKSPAVAEKIVEALQLDIKKPKIYASRFEAMKDAVKTWLGDTFRSLRNYAKYGRDIPASLHDLAVDDVESKLAVAVRKDTYAFDITYRSSDPKEAAAVANMAAKIFLDRSADAHRGEAARARAFIETQLDESGKALAQARAAVLAYKNSGETFDLKAEYDGKLKTVSDLEDILARAEGKLAGLKLKPRYSTDSQIVTEQEEEIAGLKEEISAVRSQLTAYPGMEIKLNALDLTERLAQDSYEFFLKRYEEARVNESAVVSDIRVVSRAVPALYPVKPIKLMFAGLSFVTALIVAIGWALFFEYLDPRVRSAHDLGDDLGVPMLGTIPALKRSRWTVGAWSHDVRQS